MKERLTGAIILVALMVLLVPELLTGPIGTKSAPAPSAAAASSMAVRSARTAHAQPPLRTYTLALDPAPAPREVLATPAAEAQPPRAQPAPVSQASPAPAARPPRQSTRAQPGLQVARPPAHPPVREARLPASSREWVVQLGSFADRHNAARLARSLEAKGFHVSVSPARGRSRVLWRVRTRPAHDRAGAQHLAARLRALGHRGELLPVR